MRPVLIASVLVVTACAAEDDRVTRPPGGTIGGSDAGDVDDVDAGVDAGADGVSGFVCVIDDLRDPRGCLAAARRGGVVVEDQAGTVTTTSGSGGTFALDVPGPSVTLRLGNGDPDLVESLVDTQLGSGVEAPVMDRAELDEQLALLGIAIDNAGIVVVEVLDAAGFPVQGAVVSITGGSDYEIVYDGPGGDFDQLQGETGVLGVAIIPGVLAGTQTVVGDDGMFDGSDLIRTEADVVTFARIVME